MGFHAVSRSRAKNLLFDRPSDEILKNTKKLYAGTHVSAFFCQPRTADAITAEIGFVPCKFASCKSGLEYKSVKGATLTLLIFVENNTLLYISNALLVTAVHVKTKL